MEPPAKMRRVVADAAATPSTIDEEQERPPGEDDEVKDDEVAETKLAPVEKKHAHAGEEVPSLSKQQQRMMSAQWWYYRDAQGNLQGPFYPGQMREWFLGGWLPETQQVAPSFQGEVPQSFVAISSAFDKPTKETAFRSGKA